MKIVALNNVKYKGKYRTPGTDSAEFDCTKAEAEALIEAGDAEMPRKPGQETTADKKAVAADKLIADAQKQAEQIIANAETEATAIVEAAQDEADAIANGAGSQ
ncbi:MAG: DivIVA domain-containing protein [Geopsychrobacter sp.]|nr:DivIVA domain-containing protein [Geopsychrobacter sp.]